MLLGMKGDLRTSSGSDSSSGRVQQMVDPAAAQELAKEIGELLIPFYSTRFFTVCLSSMLRCHFHTLVACVHN